ncbi:MAG: hypothetical protein ACXWCN_19310, partial [Caldimonas sp.]
MPEASPSAVPAAGATAPVEAVAERPRSALEWLNTDIGELFFGKKPADAAPGTTVGTGGGGAAAPAAAPAPAPVPPPLLAPAVPDQVREDRSDWLVKLRTGLRKTGSSIAQAFVGATIDEAMYE